MHQALNNGENPSNSSKEGSMGNHEQGGQEVWKNKDRFVRHCGLLRISHI